MRMVNFTEFRRNASAILSAVEEGEIIHVIRHGKEIAEISPLHGRDRKQPSWKRQREKLTTKGKSLSEVIIEEREHSK